MLETKLKMGSLFHQDNESGLFKKNKYAMDHATGILGQKRMVQKGWNFVRNECNVINLWDPSFMDVDDPAKVNCGQTRNTATRDVATAIIVNHINSFIMFNVLSGFIRWRTNPPSKDPTVPEPAKTIPTK